MGGREEGQAKEGRLCRKCLGALTALAKTRPLVLPLESPRQGLWTWVGVVPAGQQGSLVQASDARVDFLFSLAGFQP